MTEAVPDKHKASSPRSVSCAVITVSDTRTTEDDESGEAVARALVAEGHNVVNRAIVADEVGAISQVLEASLAAADAVVLNGGTGIGRRDVTLEAVGPYIEKEMHGFGEVFRRLSYEEIGTSAIMSRATAGVHGGKVIVVLPGAPGAARLAMRELILPEIAHMVSEASR